MFEPTHKLNETEDAPHKQSIRRTLETFISHVRDSDATKAKLLETALELVALSGKSRDGECGNSGASERIASLAVYESCVRHAVTPPFQHSHFAVRIHGLLRSKTIQKFRDEMQLKFPTNDNLRRHIFQKGMRCIRFVERAFRSYVKTNTVPKSLFYAALAIWSFVSTRIAHDDARNVPSVLVLVCSLIHECVACSPWSHYVSQNNSYVLDQILNIVAGTKIGGEVQVKQRRYMMHPDGMPCYAVAKALCACTATDSTEAWRRRADLFHKVAISDEASMSTIIEELETACELHGTTPMERVESTRLCETGAMPFSADPIVNVTVQPFVLL